MFKEKRDQIVLFLDGADEFNLDRHPLNSFIKNQYCKVPTVIWCRKWKADSIQHTCDYLYELNGFTYEQMQNFFEKCFKRKSDSDYFIEKIVTKNDNYKNICSVPLLAMIFCLLWFEEREIFEKNSFQLYERLIKLTQKKNLGTNIIKEEILMNFYRKCLKNLNSLKLEFPKDDPEFKDYEIYKGLFQVIERDEYFEIQFYHASFQEYFAASYILINLQNKNYDEFESTLKDEEFCKKTKFKLFQVFNFIQDCSIEIYQEILSLFVHLKDLTETNFLDTPRILEVDEFFNSNNIHISNTNFTETAIEKLSLTSKSLIQLTFNECIFNWKHIFKYFSMYTENINEIKVFNSKRDKLFLLEDYFLNGLLKMIINTQLKIIK